ncbi:ATP-binding protein, partial [Siphonobacter sp. BAB-5385]|uniref:sensor histidine kinase n=1 Tax=Siphonobacter sp. BAB-5385 TaxID=1864822 RepID=UPI0020CF9D34
QSAIEVAGLGTFSVDIASNLLTCSARVAEWFGFDNLTADTETFIGGVGEAEQDYVRDHLQNTILAGPEARYNVTHSIINSKTGHRTLIHALGRVYFDANGKPLKVLGIAQDITAQRELQQILENQVQQRTQELTLANQDLKRSNDNLQQFAYVASHDLQEPLRKILSFSNLLSLRLGDRLDSNITDYLDRINKSSERMSSLIKDLLEFSRIAVRQQEFGPVSVDAVVAGVLDTLSLEIEQRQAYIHIDDLPVVKGDAQQLSQLFQNLLSNALKFTPAGQAPQVRIEYFQRQIHELPPEVLPQRTAPYYHQFSVSDQGVGFDTKYLDRIFQVFQRLHTKSEFAGTGVGLAICQRVVENHGGGITASSELGQGATFCVYLPA